jgi:CBS domain containing-hemolysin-like protein
MVPLGLFLLACAAVYVGTIEAAFSALMRLSLRLMAERTVRGGVGLGRYLEQPLLLFLPTRLLLGLILALATLLMARLTGVHGPPSILLLIGSIIVFVLVAEHILPLVIIRQDPERVLNVLLPSFNVAIRPFNPLVRWLVNLMVSVSRPRVEAPPGNSTEAPGPSEGEVAHAYLEAGEHQGLIERDERRLLQSIVDFGDTLVREVMTPRPDIVAIRSDASLDELIALFREQEYSRIPVFKDNLDNIVGMVYVKDLLQIGQAQSITELMRAAFFVPETKRVSDLLKEMQRQRIRTAIVVDEYGGTAGLVSLEDLIEEIVGEIRDEYDVEGEPVTDEGNASFVFSGKTGIDELSDRLDVPIEPVGFATVGGYLLSRLGRVPAVGETFEVDGLNIEVLEAERRRVNRVRIRRGNGSREAAAQA